MYDNSEQSRKQTQWITEDNLRRQAQQRQEILREQAMQRENAIRRQKLKRLREKKQRRQQPKSHKVEIELTESQSNELLYVAFKPTRKDLCKKR